MFSQEFRITRCLKGIVHFIKKQVFVAPSPQSSTITEEKLDLRAPDPLWPDNQQLHTEQAVSPVCLLPCQYLCSRHNNLYDQSPLLGQEREGLFYLSPSPEQEEMFTRHFSIKLFLHKGAFFFQHIFEGL